MEGANSTLTDAGFGEVVPADEAGRFTATLLAARGNVVTVTAGVHTAIGDAPITRVTNLPSEHT